jgi:hypothetical protein
MMADCVVTLERPQGSEFLIEGRQRWYFKAVPVRDDFVKIYVKRNMSE